MGAPWGGITLVIIATGVIFFSILMLGKHLKRNLTGRAERVFHAAVGRGPISGIASGTVVTVMVQSSSTTTSLIVPMAGAGVMRLEQVFPFTVGANIGTTVTALLVSLASSKNPQAGLHIALVHLFFNLGATLVIFGIPFLRAIPIKGAQWLAGISIKNRSLALTYIIGLYFVLPLIIIGIMKLFSPDAAPAETGEPAPAVQTEAVESTESKPTESTTTESSTSEADPAPESKE